MRFLLAIAVVAGCLAGCRGEPPAVARLDVEPHAVRLAYPELRTVRFSWQPIAALGDGGPPEVFVHLLDRHGRVVRTFDHPFPGPWQEGTPASYEVELYQSALAPALPAGRYRLTAGLYGRAGGARWPLEAGTPVARREYQVAEVDVPAASAAPRFSYAGPWLPAEPSGDRQVVARRWLAGAGTIQARALPGAGSLWLVLSIPDGQGAGERLVFDDGANTPSVVVSGSCGSGESGLSGPGRHEIDVPADGGAHAGVCELRLKPNFTLVAAGARPARRAVALETLAWSPGPPPAPARPPAP